jgi:hypothetical protein
MNQDAPHIPYATAVSKSQHDTVYSVLLGALAFFQLLGAVTLWWVTQMPTFQANSAWAIHMVISIQVCFLLFEVVVLIIRVAAPAHRKWPTVALNVVLLISFPIGTIIGIYGLWKVDKTHP